MEYTIHRNLPLPPNPTRNRASKFPLHELDIGDAAEFPLPEDLEMPRFLQRVRAAIHYASRKTTKTFIYRVGENSITVWRTHVQ